jgi:hypothetical protein
VSDLLRLFDTTVPALSVVRMNVVTRDGSVYLEGELGGYEGQPLELRRHTAGDAAGVPVPHTVERVGDAWYFSASDPVPAGPATYRLLLVSGEQARILWSRSLDANIGLRPLALTSVYPNPAAATVRLVVESDRAREAELALFDVAGRRVHAQHASIRPGTNTLVLARETVGRLPAGLYFLRVDSGTRRVQRKLVILR